MYLVLSWIALAALSSKVFVNSESVKESGSQYPHCPYKNGIAEWN
jgi:hypothetical protein